MKQIISMAILALVAGMANAKTSFTKADADTFVTQYILEKHILKDEVDECESRVSCTEVICGRGHCNFSSDMQEVAQACRGADGKCVEIICAKGHCGFKRDALQVAQACKRANGTCVSLGCEKGHCNFRSDASDIATACMGVRDSGCVKMGCERGHCGFKSDFINLARSCAGL